QAWRHKGPSLVQHYRQRNDKGRHERDLDRDHERRDDACCNHPGACRQRAEHGLREQVVDEGCARVGKQHNEHDEYGDNGLDQPLTQFHEVRDEAFLRIFRSGVGHGFGEFLDVAESGAGAAAAAPAAGTPAAGTPAAASCKEGEAAAGAACETCAVESAPVAAPVADTPAAGALRPASAFAAGDAAASSAVISAALATPSSPVRMSLACCRAEDSTALAASFIS